MSASGFRGRAIGVLNFGRFAIPERVRVLDGVTDSLCGSSSDLSITRNGISQIEKIWNKNNWLVVSPRIGRPNRGSYLPATFPCKTNSTGPISQPRDSEKPGKLLDAE